MKRKNEKNEKGYLSDGLSALIKRGTDITLYASSGVVHRRDQDEVDNMHETFKDFHTWKMDTRDFFLKYNFEDEANFFFEGDSVPVLKGGIEYSYIDSPESQELLKNIREEAKEKLKFLREFKKEVPNGRQFGDQRNLRSIHLVTTTLLPKEGTIFLVFDESYQTPIRFLVKNKEGEESTIKKLYRIAYIVDVKESQVPYTERLADNINNGLFKKHRGSDYMRTNKIGKKPTLVKKVGNFLVLNNEILIKTQLVKEVPLQYQSLYKNRH